MKDAFGTYDKAHMIGTTKAHTLAHVEKTNQAHMDTYGWHIWTGTYVWHIWTRAHTAGTYCAKR